MNRFIAKQADGASHTVEKKRKARETLAAQMAEFEKNNGNVFVGAGGQSGYKPKHAFEIDR